MNSKFFAAALTVVLTGCSTGATGPSARDGSAGGAAAPVATPSGSNGQCDASTVQTIVGERFSDRAAQNAQSRAGASTLRVLQPGQVMTMEYNPQRLTVVVDESGAIASARCG
nr:hypothetical protein [Pseudomonas sp.]